MYLHNVDYIGFLWILSGIRGQGYICSWRAKTCETCVFNWLYQGCALHACLNFLLSRICVKDKTLQEQIFQNLATLTSRFVCFERQDVASPKGFEDGLHWTSLDGTKTPIIRTQSLSQIFLLQEVNKVFRSADSPPTEPQCQIFINPFHAIWYLMLHLEFPM